MQYCVPWISPNVTLGPGVGSTWGNVVEVVRSIIAIASEALGSLKGEQSCFGQFVNLATRAWLNLHNTRLPCGSQSSLDEGLVPAETNGWLMST